MTARGRLLLPVALPVLMALAACGSDEDALREDLAAVTAEDEGTEEVLVPVDVSTELVDAEGSTVGQATFRDVETDIADAVAEVQVEVTGLTEGFHPLYLTETGTCEPESAAPGDPARLGPFLSAGDVRQELPPVLVLENGVGTITTLVGPFSLEQLLDGDGTALVAAESLGDTADVPPAEVPNEGAGGSRVACGAIGGPDGT